MTPKRKIKNPANEIKTVDDLKNHIRGYYNEQQRNDLTELYKEPYLAGYVYDVTGDVARGDQIAFVEAVFKGVYPNTKFSHFSLIRGTIIKDSYGKDKQQHTFTIKTTDGDVIRRKGRNVYKYLTLALPFDETTRNERLEEKHERGSLARARKSKQVLANIWNPHTDTFTPGMLVIWYNPKNKRTGIVVETKQGLKVETNIKGKKQLWPLIYDGNPLWVATTSGAPKVTAPVKVEPKETKLSFSRSVLLGETDTIKSPTRKYEIQYALVPFDQVIASHDEWSFAKSPEYPAQCQERNYHADKTEQYKVINNTKNFDPRFVVSKSPTATDGPPVVLNRDGLYIVIGGNSRAMTIKRFCKDITKNPQDYFGYVQRNLDQFGITGDAQGKMLVRIITNKDASAIDNCSRVSRDLNESFIQAKDLNTEAASMAKSISMNTLDTLSALLDKYDSLAEFYSSSDARILIDAMEMDGIITPNNANKYLLPNGSFTDEAKEIITKMLVAQIITDKDHLAMMSKTLSNKIAYIIPQLINLKYTDWDVSEQVRKIVELDIKKGGTADLNAFLSQQSMFEEIVLTNCEYILALSFQDYGVRKLKEKFIVFLNSARANSGLQMFNVIPKPEAIEKIFAPELKSKLKFKNPMLDYYELAYAEDYLKYHQRPRGKNAHGINDNIWDMAERNTGKVKVKNPDEYGNNNTKLEAVRMARAVKNPNIGKPTRIQMIIEKIIKAAGRKAEYDEIVAKGIGGEFHLEIVNQPYMPLTIEVIGKDGISGQTLVSVCHYGEQNGDLMRDPEIVYEIQGGTWIPVYYRNDYASYEKNLVKRRDNTGKITHIITDGISNIWARNLLEQGFVDAAKIANARKMGNPTESISIPVEDGLALLAKAVVLKIDGKIVQLKNKDLYGTADRRWLIVAPSTLKNWKPSKPSSDAVNLYEDFRHYPHSKTGRLKIPFENGLEYIGELNAVEYDSDKMIFKTDKRTGRKTKREYVHDFDDPPEIFKVKGSSALIAGPMSKKITKAGIEA